MVVIGRWSGQETKALRLALRMTIEAFAEHLGVATRTVAKWEARGSGIIPLPIIQDALDTVLEKATPEQQARFEVLRAESPPGPGVPLRARAGNWQALDRATAVTRIERSQEQAAAQSAAGLDSVFDSMHACEKGLAVEDLPDVWDEIMGTRRDFLAGAGATAITALVPGLSTRSTSRVSDVPQAMAAYRALTASYRRLDSVLGPGSVYARAIDHHRQLTTWLRDARDTEWRGVAGLVTDAGILVAWLHFDLERYEDAVALYRQGFDIAGELDNVDLRAFLVGRMSRTLSECGHHADALSFAGAAQRVAGSEASPTVRSWLAVTRAYVNGCLGDEQACRSDLDRAAALLDHDTAESPASYIAFYDSAYLHKWTGRALLKLAERKNAVLAEAGSVIDRALSVWSPSDVRESGEVVAVCASARLAEGEIEEAARLTGHAYDIAADAGSLRILRYVTDLRTRLHPYRHTRAVRVLDERRW